MSAWQRFEEPLQSAHVHVDLELGGEGSGGDCQSKQAFPYWGEMFQLVQV